MGRGEAKQTEFNWTFLQRKYWIDNAVMRDGRADDGTGVRAGKLVAFLHKINEHLGDNEGSWPSREEMADKIRCSTKTITRAAQALARQSLVITVPKKNKKGQRDSNYYIVIWTELQLLVPEWREAYAKMSNELSSPRDVASSPRDVTSNPRDVASNPRDVTSPEQLTTNNSKNNSKNNSPLQRSRRANRRTEPQTLDVPAAWLVVVSALEESGMGDRGGAVTAARRRKLTPADVLDLVERWNSLRASQPHVTVGYLYRWITGQSRPPWEEDSQAGTRKAASLTSETTEREKIRAKVVKAGRRAGVSEERIEARVTEALAHYDRENPKEVCHARAN